MSRKKGATSDGQAHLFGGDWTSAKLKVLEGYLNSYTQALKKQTFQKVYIDAFAGTGYRATRRDTGSTSLLFPDLAESEPQKLLDGSARIALHANPAFDQYVFIEKNHERCGHLERLRDEFPRAAARISIEQGDANEAISRLCGGNWGEKRAVLFLDPYGMQVEWGVIEAIARTKAIDLWVLFPLGIGVNRLLTRSGDIPDPWRRRLDLLLGTEDWYEEFYQVESHSTLFGGEEERVVKTTVDTIGRYFNNRLKSVFADVAEPPGVLRNSSNCPLYLLCFAAGNERGAPIALRIANHLLKELR